MNSPNDRYDDDRIIFESQHTIDHLKRLGVSSKLIFGDMFSWDTVSNGLVLRQYLEAILAFKPGFQKNNGGSFKQKKMQIKIFISDFHMERVRAAFSWIISLEPSLDPFVDLEVINL